VQCLAVSHHDLSQFSGTFHIARIAGEPASGVEVQSSDPSVAWDDAQPGLRFIRLVNVQAYQDATLRLSPGVNALIGPNNRGKSTFIRALRAVFYGEARDSLVRAGAKAALVEIGVAGNRVLRFTRQPRRSPVNIWSLHEADGAIVEEAGMRYETGGRAVPDWVADLIRIRKVEDLDVHIAHQKFPVFLLGETPSRRSAVLSIGQEAGYIRDMLVIHRERCRRDNDLMRNGERELIALGETLDGLQELDRLKEKLSTARERSKDLKSSAAHLDKLRHGASLLADLGFRLEKARRRAAITATLPAAERLADLTRMVERSRERDRVGRNVIQLGRHLALSQARLAALQDMPQAVPALDDTAPAQNMLKRIDDLRKAAAIAQGRIATIDEGLIAIRSEMERFIAETGGLCPTCGSPVKPETLLDHHDHSSHSTVPSERLTA